MDNAKLSFRCRFRVINFNFMNLIHFSPDMEKSVHNSLLMYDYRCCFQKKSGKTWSLAPDGKLNISNHN